VAGAVTGVETPQAARIMKTPKIKMPLRALLFIEVIIKQFEVCLDLRGLPSF
jgi:hypothetical protein